MRKTAVGVTPPPRTTKPDRRAHRDRLSPGRLRARKQIRPRPGDAGRAHWPGVTDRGPTPRDAGRPRRPARTARGSGATGEGSGVLHEVRGFVQYAQPLAGALPPSWSRRSEMASRGRPDRIGPATRSAVTSKSRRRPCRSCPCITETQAGQACERGPLHLPSGI